jgi:pimeloyl-ACP methyl ester carboxylesterase
MELWGKLHGWRHIGLDAPGHGCSLPLRRGEELPALARRIGAVAIARGALHIVALSFGSVLALQVALEYPGAFASLTLAAPMLGGGPFDRDISVRYATLKSIFAEVGYTSELSDRWIGSGASLFRGIEACPQLATELARQVHRHPWWELADDTYQRLWQIPQSLKELGRIALPTLLLVGGDDAPAVHETAYFLERVITDCQRCDLTGLGHLCILEAPARVQPIIQQHWRAQAAPAVVDERGTGHNHAAHD